MLKDIALQIINGNINNTSVPVQQHTVWVMLELRYIMLCYVMQNILITLPCNNNFGINLTQLEHCQHYLLLL